MAYKPHNMETSLNNPLVLASNSPRRKELLALGGWSFRVQSADINESVHPAEPPQDYVLRLAKEKAAAVALEADSTEIVLAADTAVVDSGCILGKPNTQEHAVQMLRQLRGHTHQVVTALVVLRIRDSRMVTEICTSNVPMREYTDAEIEAYVVSGDPMDKAGAYAIQNNDFHPVPAMSGCFASVMGLPLCHLHRALGKLDQENLLDIPSKCQSALGYTCDYYPVVLNSETTYANN